MTVSGKQLNCQGLQTSIWGRVLEDFSDCSSYAENGNRSHLRQVCLKSSGPGYSTRCMAPGAQADIRCRTEFWSQEKRKQETFHATQHFPLCQHSSRASCGTPSFVLVHFIQISGHVSSRSLQCSMS